ncbi:hypothetical protein Ddye_022311 [Dipteronia dyeriana]|uniref:Uncharacterized protein n=1 Tax=Dipteronia dyeriana TaxID=168575 RepID=A0AAD9WXQ2_9ROSI|nr:hypothetical protein Ddye_022311 [Dipteronia dyeriana]
MTTTSSFVFCFGPFGLFEFNTCLPVGAWSFRDSTLFLSHLNYCGSAAKRQGQCRRQRYPYGNRRSRSLLYPPSLRSLSLSSPLPPEVKNQGQQIAAATYLKNFTRRNVESDVSSSNISKEFKDQLLHALLQAEKVLLEAFRVILVAEFLKQTSWPELVSELQSAIQNSNHINNGANCGLNTVNALMVLHAIIRPFQYFLNPKVAKEPVPPQLELISKEILVPMLAVFSATILYCFCVLVASANWVLGELVSCLSELRILLILASYFISFNCSPHLCSMDSPVLNRYKNICFNFSNHSCEELYGSCNAFRLFRLVANISSPPCCVTSYDTVKYMSMNILDCTHYTIVLNTDSLKGLGLSDWVCGIRLLYSMLETGCDRRSQSGGTCRFNT